MQENVMMSTGCLDKSFHVLSLLKENNLSAGFKIHVFLSGYFDLKFGAIAFK